METRKLHHLNFLSLSGINVRHYAVSVKYFKGEASIPYKRLDYRAKVSISASGELYLDKKEIRYNQREPDSHSERVAQVFTNSIYPVKMAVNSEGLSPQLVLNKTEIEERFKRLSLKFKEKYSSKVLDQVFQKFEFCLNHPIYLQDILRNDWFCNLLFHPKLLHYSANNNIDMCLALAVIPYGKPLLFQGKQSVTDSFTTYHAHVIRFESEEQVAPSYFTAGQENKAENYYIQLHVLFDIDIYRYFTMHSRATILVYSKDALNNNILHKRIEYRQYQQNTKQNFVRTTENEQSFLVEEGDKDESKKVKKGFWNWFN